MISLLVTILVIALLIGLAIYAVRLLPIPAPFGNIAVAVLIVIAIIFLLYQLPAVGLR